jgi:hypothetical protein
VSQNLQKPAIQSCPQMCSIYQEELQIEKQSGLQSAQFRRRMVSQDLQKPVHESISMFASRKVINYTDILAAIRRGFSYDRL